MTYQITYRDHKGAGHVESVSDLTIESARFHGRTESVEATLSGLCRRRIEAMARDRYGNVVGEARRDPDGWRWMVGW